MKKQDNSTAHNAAIYDSQIEATIPYYRNFHDETIALVKTLMPSPGIWLDTGCGTGTLALKASAAFPEARFLLADPSGPMLAIAREKLAGRGNVTFLGEVDTIGLPPQEPLPDIITAIQSHHYLSAAGRAAAVTRCFELLRPDGLFIVFENIRPRTDAGIRNAIIHCKRFQMNAGKSAEEAEKHMLRFASEYFPITVREHLDLYERAGFRVCEIFWYSYLQAGFYCVK